MRLLLRIGAVAVIVVLMFVSIGLHRDHLLDIQRPVGDLPALPQLPGTAASCPPARRSRPAQPLFVWCFPLAAPPATTRVIDPWGGWVDTFGTADDPLRRREQPRRNRCGQPVLQLHRKHGDGLPHLERRHDERPGHGHSTQDEGFINNHHWMFDLGGERTEAARSSPRTRHSTGRTASWSSRPTWPPRCMTTARAPTASSRSMSTRPPRRPSASRDELAVTSSKGSAAAGHPLSTCLPLGRQVRVPPGADANPVRTLYYPEK